MSSKKREIKPLPFVYHGAAGSPAELPCVVCGLYRAIGSIALGGVRVGFCRDHLEMLGASVKALRSAYIDDPLRPRPERPGKESDPHDKVWGVRATFGETISFLSDVGDGDEGWRPDPTPETIFLFTRAEALRALKWWKEQTPSAAFVVHDFGPALRRGWGE